MEVTKARAVSSDYTTGGSLIHADEPKPDFGGYVTKYDIKCTDGRTIKPDAFKHQDGQRIPLVWQHNTNSPENVLGHVILRHRDDGMYGEGFFNQTRTGQAAKALVHHEDIKHLSIHANELIERAKSVFHGIIREVSTVLAGANPGALIDNLELAHGDEITVLTDEAIIHSGETITHSDSTNGNEGPTVGDVYDAMTEEQRAAVLHMVDEAFDQGKSEADGNTATHTSADAASALAVLPAKTDNRKVTHSMSRNLFDETHKGGDKPGEIKHAWTPDTVREVMADAARGGSLRHALETYALKHGINDIQLLFPEARTVTDTPEFDKRRTEWVSKVLAGVRKNPFSRIKSLMADITQEEARAKGYIKGTFKKEEWFGLVRRITTPTTIYKKQKLDRDDIVDITEMDVVQWMWGEMRLMLDEELARVVLIGDGREVDDEDKVKDPAGISEGAGIRSIYHDDDLYAATITLDTSDDRTSPSMLVDKIIQSKRFYKGSGSPSFFTSLTWHTKLLLAKDTTGRRMYNSDSELASALGVSEIVDVEVMDNEADLIGIIVNLRDYTIGTDRGGEITSFDDFDIDFNQYKYLLEGRCSGALTKIRSALVLVSAAADAELVVPTEPAFDTDTNRVTVPTITGVTYKRADTDATLRNDTPIELDRDTLTSLKVYAVPARGYFFNDNIDDEWTFTFQA